MPAPAAVNAMSTSVQPRRTLAAARQSAVAVDGCGEPTGNCSRSDPTMIAMRSRSVQAVEVIAAEVDAALAGLVEQLAGRDEVARAALAAIEHDAEVVAGVEVALVARRAIDLARRLLIAGDAAAGVE